MRVFAAACCPCVCNLFRPVTFILSLLSACCVLQVPDPDYAAVVQRAEAEGWGYYSVIHNVPEVRRETCA